MIGTGPEDAGSGTAACRAAHHRRSRAQSRQLQNVAPLHGSLRNTAPIPPAAAHNPIYTAQRGSRAGEDFWKPGLSVKAVSADRRAHRLIAKDALARRLSAGSRSHQQRNQVLLARMA